MCGGGGGTLLNMTFERRGCLSFFGPGGGLQKISSLILIFPRPPSFINNDRSVSKVRQAANNVGH